MIISCQGQICQLFFVSLSCVERMNSQYRTDVWVCCQDTHMRIVAMMLILFREIGVLAAVISRVRNSFSSGSHPKQGKIVEGCT